MPDITSHWIRWPAVILALIVAASIGHRVVDLPREPYLGMSERPGQVGIVYAGGPAAGAGLRGGDRILSLNGQSAAQPRGHAGHAAPQPPGRGVFLTVARGDSTFVAELMPDPLPPRQIVWLVAHALVASPRSSSGRSSSCARPAG